MSAIMTAAYADSSALLTSFRHLVAVVVAVVREDGQLIDCNEGFLRLLHRYGVTEDGDIADFFILPRFDSLASVPPAQGRMIHCGVLNVGDKQFGCRSLLGTVHRDGRDLIVVAEHDVEEMERLNTQVVHLNEELALAQRSLGRQARNLRVLTQTDPLTGLANRRRLDEFLQNEYTRVERYGEPVSVIVADIDHFKRVNDRYGHDKGDEVLQCFASLLRMSIRETDLVARVGGEEFIVVMPMTSIADAITSAERLRTYTQEMHPPSLPDEMRASFGVAQSERGDSIANLLKHADEALYAAKNKGRNRVEAYPQRLSS